MRAMQNNVEHANTVSNARSANNEGNEGYCKQRVPVPQWCSKRNMECGDS